MARNTLAYRMIRYVLARVRDASTRVTAAVTGRAATSSTAWTASTDGLSEIYSGPMDNIAVAFQIAYGKDKGKLVIETARAGAIAFNQGVPVQLSGNPTVGHPLARLGDCGALLDMLSPGQMK